MSQSQSAGASSHGPTGVAPPNTGPRYSRRGSLFAVGAATTVVAVPLALELGMWVGTRSANTVQAVVPALLVVVLLPPLAVVLAENAWARRLKKKRPRAGLAVAASLGAQLLTVAAAIFAGVSAPRYGDAVLLTMVEALLLPLVVTSLGYPDEEPSTPGA